MNKKNVAAGGAAIRVPIFIFLFISNVFRIYSVNRRLSQRVAIKHIVKVRIVFRPLNMNMITLQLLSKLQTKFSLVINQVYKSIGGRMS